MRRTIITVLALSLMLFACGDLSEGDLEQLDDLFEELEEIAESQAGSDSDSGSDADSGSDSDNGSDSEDPPANTSSPNRPSLPPGGERISSSSNDEPDAIVENEEEFLFGPTDASHEDIVDFYTEAYGEPFSTRTRADGTEVTQWSSNETGTQSSVSVKHDGFETTVTIQYDD